MSTTAVNERLAALTAAGIPGRRYTFRTLISAQADGDLQTRDLAVGLDAITGRI